MGVRALIVSSPDLIRRVYRFQYNAHDTESDSCWGWVWVWDRDYAGHCYCSSLRGQLSEVCSEEGGEGTVVITVCLRKS